MHWWDAGEFITALASLIVAFVALFVARSALDRADRNASASNLVALHEALRQAWERFLDPARREASAYNFAELCNCLEIACVILADNAVHGAARELIEQLLNEQLGLIDNDDVAEAQMKALQQETTTFKYLRSYIRDRRKTVRLRPEFTVIPPEGG